MTFSPVSLMRSLAVVPDACVVCFSFFSPQNQNKTTTAIQYVLVCSLKIFVANKIYKKRQSLSLSHPMECSLSMYSCIY